MALLQGAALTKSGSGVFTLSGSNTYSGVTTITGGTLLAGGTQALSANSAVKVADTDGALLNLNGYSSTIGGLAGGGTLGGNVVMGSGTLTLRTAALGAMDIVSMAGGLSHSLLLKSDGSVWAWGWDDRQQGYAGAGDEWNHCGGDQR
jgi:autotransporter-associated beta strand protein